jgi:hypothetical protein
MDKWIMVSERLPEIGISVILCFGKIVGEGCLRSDRFWCFYLGDMLLKHYQVTHWMPLPEPPKEEP